LWVTRADSTVKDKGLTPERLHGREPRILARTLRAIAVALLTAGLLLAGCQAAPSPSNATAQPTATVRPTPGSTTEPPSSAEVISAFLAILKDPRLTMHVVTTGEMTARTGSDTQLLWIDMEMDVKGNDVVGDASVDVGGRTISFDLLVIDGRGYLDENGTWTELPDYEQTVPLNPFTNLTKAGNVEYRGQLERDGRRLHRLRALNWFGSDLAAMAGTGWTRVRIMKNMTTVRVDDEGTPVSLDFVGRLSGLFDGAKATADFDFSYDFSVGEPVTIPSPN
jgi:hypothetical protein